MPDVPAIFVPRGPVSDRFELLVKIATGGTSTVYVGRARGSAGFERLVAIKRAHPHLREDPRARRALVREARLSSRIHHANVVSILDVEESEHELLLVMEYVEGASLAELLEAGARAGSPMPPAIAVRILLDACEGLTAAHACTDERGAPLGLVHRDVSPQNVLVGLDGTARIADFGLARPAEPTNVSTTAVKGKIAYLAPEYVEGADFTARCDVFSMAVVAWETLAGERLFRGTNDADTLRRVLAQTPLPVGHLVPALGRAFDTALARALDKRPERRTPTMEAFATDLGRAARALGLGATPAEVGRLVGVRFGGALEARRALVRACLDVEATATPAVGQVEIGGDAPPTSETPTALFGPRTPTPDEPRTAPATPALDEASPATEAPAQEEPSLSTGRMVADLAGSHARRRRTLVAVMALAVTAVATLALTRRTPTAPPQATAAASAATIATATATPIATATATATPTATPIATATATATPTATASAVTAPRPAPSTPPLPANPYKGRLEGKR
jgi:serine/threonine-protein kinase